ncbi:hypothetical protein [Arthrobacter sp. E3]|uniref:baeRF11 domain-containing protein n=1 Tax=Arthrobacter sp. E3 TaxID=517402 RepID=UPI001A9536D6|nr:hypothetical protein [Arthrobacter sp. E3]
MHIDMPTHSDIERLASARESLCVSIYLPTSTVPVDSESNQLRARTLFKTAMGRVRERADENTAAAVEEQLNSLLEDTSFWFDLGRSLAVFVTPEQIVEYRLPNELEEQVGVSDRFAIIPILRATTFRHSAFVLAISQNGLRLVEVSADMPAKEVPLPDAPHDAASAVGLGTVGSRSSHERLKGDENRKVRLMQYSRAVDHALRPILNGKPLILAAAEPLASIYRNVTGYAQVASELIRGNPDDLTEAQLADGAREILDGLYAAELADLRATFADRRQSGRASADLSDLARAAAFGAIGTLAVDMNALVPGNVDDDGHLTLDPGSDNDAIEEIARHAISAGARVLAVRQSDLPENVQAAGILRYAV